MYGIAFLIGIEKPAGKAKKISTQILSHYNALVL
tara:strand:+ start:226 stop:327 length:102 start_codon:yes stop_codon:yes gene_type:complete